MDNFDFELHKINAIEQYQKVRPIYEAFALAVKSILEKKLMSAAIKYHSIEARAKDIDKFGEKAAKHSLENINEPKYINPLIEITDLAGIRIITFFLETINEVDRILYEEFDIIEKSDKNDILEIEEKLGYQSVHYLAKLKPTRTALSEYSTFQDQIVEIQVRTILQHAWAEIEHDIEYKSSTTIPKMIKRRFMALAGMLEMGDREFQSIHDDNLKLKYNSRQSVNLGKLEGIEITADSLKTYLDKKYGSDGRMTEFSYDLMARYLLKIGFKDLKEVDDCIHDYDDDKISRIIWGIRQGQISRFEDTLLSSIGEEMLNRHPYCTDPQNNTEFWKATFIKKLNTLKSAGIEIGKYKFRS